ncbi:unnamed protein product [Durusdinium trenchii]|uniref:EGF-like domain-containing protein n=1 Tax=Durusdinium trenchii TaxID=1381693 RepID=A0ABP0LPB7_9DINO
MVDMWDHDGSLTRNWDNRTLPTDQTQAGLGGVCVEYMVELANRLGADPWFSMPKAAETESDSVDPYAMAFALLVNQTLDSNLRIYVEYRSCCRAGLAPGWDSDNAVQSLVLWKSWEQAGVDPSRVVNVMSALQQLTKLYGSSVTSVEAAAIDVSFSDVCKYGETPCVDFNSLEANGTYGGLTPLELIDAVIRPAMLKQEVEINARVQQALYYGFEIIAFNAMPLISARSYGHRGNLNWALGCESCLMSALGRRYGARERSQLAVDGWVHEVDFEAYKAYQGLQEEDRALDDQGSYWLVGSPSEAKAHCQAMSECDGFSYYKSGEWSCGVGNDFRYGDCVTPGAAYFFKRTRIQSGERKPPTHCSAFTVPGDPYNQCVTGRMDSYFKADAEIPGDFGFVDANVLKAFCFQKACQIAYTPAPWDPPAEGFTLDDLREILPAVIAAAEGEQKLENMMIEAFRDPVMEDLMLEYLERLRLIGFSTVVGGQMVRQARLCRTGGKACGQASVMLHWDDDSPIRRAMTGYVQGRRATPEKPSPPAPSCPQRCIYGICELGSCKCWKGASGADCSILAPVECHRGRRLGLSLSGVSYWTREWIFVDVFKHVGEWIAQELTSYDWNTGTELDLRSDGYPARLELNQVATLLTVRDVERHYVGGWYTVIYDGEGILDFSMDVTCVHRMSRNHIQIYVNLTTGLNNGIGIRLTDTNEADPVRNIRIVTPGFEETYETSPFHPAFLASLENFTVLRFMDWMHANSGNTPEEWEDRVTPSYYTQGSHPGVSLEYMVRLSNEVGAEPWFSVPVNATDDYIQNFVQYVSDNLRPDLGIYIELGNEAWHPKFFGGQWAQQQGAAEGLSQLCWYAKRSGEMAQITKSVIGSSRNVTAVANTQASNWDAMSQLLQCEGINDMDAFGVGPYFNGYNLLPNPDADLDLVLSSYESEVNTSIQWVRDHKVALEGTKFKLVSYESGPAGEGDGSANDLAIQAHRNPRMKQILRTYLEELNKDLDLMVYFASCGKPSQYGSWGMIEAMDQPREDAYKYQAVQEFLSSGMPPSCSVERQDCEAADGCSGNGLCGVDDQCYCYRGFSGTTCLDASFTDYSSCGYRCTFDQGICQVSEVIGNLRSWACNCRAEYSGGKCSRFSCPNGCNQRGHCIASSVCSCFRGYRGSQCEIDCGCGHHGQCDSNNECICDQGWRKSAVGCEWDCSTVDTLGCTGPGQSACSACQYGTCIDGQCHCWAGYYGTDCSTLDSNLLAHKGAAFGINVATTPSTFVDVMKTTRHWTSIWDADTQPGQFSYQGGSVMWTSRQYEWGNGLEINETFDGYVASLKQDQALITLALRDVCLHAPHGRYVVTYDGDGEIDFAMDANPVAFQKGRIDVDFQPTCRRECWFDKANWLPYCSDNGIAITIRRVNPSNPLRNVRIIMPGQTQRQGLCKVGVGEPEVMWRLEVTVHHLASDDYVRQEASFWLQHLRPDVQVYVEHSNEVWNPLFPQGRYATQKGTELGLVDGTCRTPHCGRVRYNAYRSKQIFDIWADVWSSGSRSRLKFVISTQAVWGDATNDLLSLNSGAGADLLGITGYMSPQGGIDQSYSAKTPAEVIELFTSGKESARSWVKEQKAIADAAGLGITFYEGGVGLVEDGTIETGQAIGAITELLMATGRSAAFQGAVEAWLDMFREELGDALFMYFVDTGFWSKYGQWGNREYYDAATATSPAAAAVHAYLDRLAGSRPACVAQNSAGRGLPPDSFLGPPAVWKPARGDILVKGKRYKLSWGDPERLPIDLLLDFHLWQRSSCPGEAASDIHLGFANAAAGTFTWEVPSSIEAGDEYFVELRARAPAAFPSNYSSFFSVVNQVDAPPTYLLYVENDVDLLSAFHRDCKKGDEWAIQPHFRISSCVYSSAEGCRQYRTSRSHDGPPPYLHGSGLPLKDCTLHVVGLRQTLRLEGLTRGFDLTAEDSLARAVSNASQLPPGAIAITVVGGSAGRRLAEATGVVTLELSMTSDDSGVGSAALSLSSLSSNTIFLGEAASALGAPSLSVVTGNLSAVDGSSAEEFHEWYTEQHFE